MKYPIPPRIKMGGAAGSCGCRRDAERIGTGGSSSQRDGCPGGVDTALRTQPGIVDTIHGINNTFHRIDCRKCGNL